MIRIPGGTCSDLCDPGLVIDTLRPVARRGVEHPWAFAGVAVQAVVLRNNSQSGCWRPRLGHGEEYRDGLSPGGPSHPSDLWIKVKTRSTTFWSGIQAHSNEDSGVSTSALKILFELAKLTITTMIRLTGYTPNGL